MSGRKDINRNHRQVAERPNNQIHCESAACNHCEVFLRHRKTSTFVKRLGAAPAPYHVPVVAAGGWHTLMSALHRPRRHRGISRVHSPSSATAAPHLMLRVPGLPSAKISV